MMNKSFQVYVGVMLMIIVLLMATLVGGLIYAARDVKTQANNINLKVNNLNHNLNQLNGDLNNIDNQLKIDNSDTNSLKP